MLWFEIKKEETLRMLKRRENVHLNFSLRRYYPDQVRGLISALRIEHPQSLIMQI
jgi:hypothetical protein